MTRANWPDLHHQVAWAADPNDPVAVPVWATAPPVMGIDRIKYGRDYELAVTRVFDSNYTFYDRDEYVNPSNTSSPYHPYVQPFRQLLTKSVWPKGQTGNLLNLNNWRVPIDGSFESYAVGETPEFLTAWVTSTTPVVGTFNPHSGTKSLTYNVATLSNRQGVQWSIPCVPGQQYTLSAYVRQNSASTQVLRVTDQVLSSTTFNRSTGSGWGTDDAPLNVGGAWTNVMGLASERYTVPATAYAPSYAALAIGNANSRRYQLPAGTMRDGRQRVRFSIPAVATGGYYSVGCVARYADSDNHYYLEIRFNTNESVTLHLFRRVAAVNTQIGSTYTLPGVVYAAGDQFCADFYVLGDLLRAAVWREGSPVASSVDDPQVSASDSTISAAGSFGLRTLVESTNTNTLPITPLFYNYSCVGGVESSTMTAVGTYGRLLTTFTATAPYHTAVVSTTQGTAVAGTVNVDGVMLNTGASAPSFTSTGSTIYPLALASVERWPRTYDETGFLGTCKAPAVDALANWAAISLPSDYDYQVRILGPDYFWPLEGGQNATLYPDATGNGNPPLGLNISKFGVGELPTGGTALDVPGGAGMTGVTFFPPSPATGATLAGTSLGTGQLAEAPQQPFVLPQTLSPPTGTWAVSVAAWVKCADTTTGQSVFYPSKQLSSTAGASYIPAYMNADGPSAYSNVGSTGTIHLLSSGSGLSGIDPTDGQPHLHITIVTQDLTGSTFVYRYIDNVLDGVGSATTASLGGPLRGQTDSLSVGATDDGARFLGMVNGTVSRLAVWNRELNPAECTLLYQAGAGTQLTSGDRLERDAAQGGYTGQVRVDTMDTISYAVGDPVTLMQTPTWTGRMDLLTQAQNITLAEQGTLWAGPDGVPVLEGRAARFNRLEPQWVLGEDEAGGEFPYLGNLEFDYDPTFTYSDVEVSRPGGAAATGGLAADVAMSRRRYFPRAYTQSSDFATDEQAQDCADFIFYSHRAPNLRVGSITLDPASNPDLWPFVLGVMVGQRGRVIRRAKAGNAGAGATMTADFFVETIGHIGIDPESGRWEVELLLSPVGTAPGPTVQPWILEDPTYGVLDSTTVLGW